MKKNFSKLNIVFVFLVFIIAACNSSENNQENTSDTKDTVANHKKEKAHEWGYIGKQGPEHWCEFYKTCCGEQQSPIDITETINEDVLGRLTITYKLIETLKIANNGHSISVSIPDGSKISFADGDFTLKSFHFHCPSEHTINGEKFPMEIHLVHQNEAGNFAVVGLMVKEGSSNQFLTSFWDYLPPEKGMELEEMLSFDLTNLLPDDKTYYTYDGSLTTPPCTEGVKWIVMKKPIEASSDQITIIGDLMPKNNARPVQKLNGRTVVEK